MPYVPGGTAHGVVHVADVYKSPNVYANSVPIALWLSPGASGVFSYSGSVVPVDIGNLAASNTSTDYPNPISAVEGTYIFSTLDGDGIQDASTSSAQAVAITSAYSEGVSSGIITSASSVATSVGPADTTAPAMPPASVVGADWSKFTQDNIPYNTLMLTPKTSLATFTTKATLWQNQPKPFGPNTPFTSNNPNKGDNKHIREQDIIVNNKVIGRITVPQILHNLSNLAANVYEPIKAKYPNVVVTNTFRQNPPGASSKQAQHGMGMAMDLVFPGADAAQYFEIAKWIRDNINFDQLLQEKSGQTRWIHISHYSGFGYKVPTINKVANMVVAPQYSFTPGLSVMT